MKEVDRLSYIRMNGEDILLISDDYYGVPMIGYAPSKIIVTEKTYNRCKRFIIAKYTPDQVVFI